MVARSAAALAETFDGYLEAIRAGDRRRAFAVIDAALQGEVELGRVYVDVLQRAMREIGRLWEENEITVADEHLATAITQAAMARAFEGAYRWSAGPQHSLIGACVDAERHEVGLRMICDLLEMEGWDTTYLGATVPMDSLIGMIGRRKPDAVALSVAIVPHLPRLRMVIEEIRLLVREPPIIMVGGRPFLERPELARQLGADFTAGDAVQAVKLLKERVAGG